MAVTIQYAGNSTFANLNCTMAARGVKASSLDTAALVANLTSAYQLPQGSVSIVNVSDSVSKMG